MSYYIGNETGNLPNQHQINLTVQALNSERIHLYATAKGFRMLYYGDVEVDNEPMLDRIEPFLPGRFDLQYRLMTYFSVHIEFVLRLQLA